MAKTVYILWFEREYSDREDTELLIGVYETADDAKAAIDRLKQKPGFCEFPEGFSIYDRELGSNSWDYGYITKFVARSAWDCRPIAFDLPAYEELMVPDQPPANDP